MRSSLLHRSHVCVDMDGVLMNLLGALEKRMKQENSVFCLQNVLTYRFNQELDKEVVGYDYEENLAQIYAYLNDPTLFEQAEWYLGARSFIRQLADTHFVTIYTLAGNSDVAKVKRTQLERSFSGAGIDFNIKVGKKKAPLFGVDTVIDDCLENLRVYAPGVNKLLFKQRYNDPKNLRFYKDKGQAKDLALAYTKVVQVPSYASILAILEGSECVKGKGAL